MMVLQVGNLISSMAIKASSTTKELLSRVVLYVKEYLWLTTSSCPTGGSVTLVDLSQQRTRVGFCGHASVHPDVEQCYDYYYFVKR